LWSRLFVVSVRLSTPPIQFIAVQFLQQPLNRGRCLYRLGLVIVSFCHLSLPYAAPEKAWFVYDSWIMNETIIARGEIAVTVSG
jgi:hypothetical protein